MTRADRIRTQLAIFAPLALTVEDESAKHAGHAGVLKSGGGGETHYAVHIVSDQFTGLTRVERQRRVYAALDAEFQSGLHALSLKALTPNGSNLNDAKSLTLFLPFPLSQPAE